MTLLQPTEVPSRAGINNAITSEIADAVSTTDPSDQFYDSGWLDIPDTGRNASLGVTTAQYRIKNGMVQFQGSGVLTASYSVGSEGNGSDWKVGDVPAGARPGGMGISTWFLGEGPSQIALHWVVYNGGAFNLGGADARGAAYSIPSGSAWQCMSGLYIINS